MTSHKQPSPHEHRTSVSNSNRGQRFVFWSLLTMGFIGFAPCVLLPEWRQYDSLRMAERKEAYRLEQMESLVQRERASYEALRDDPAVLARLAQRDLSFRRLDQQDVFVPAGELMDWPGSEDESDAHLGYDGSGPSIVAMIVARLPAYNYDAVFCDDRTRSIVMTMSVALIALAFLLFPRGTAIPE